jgi:hypothetical protein
VVKLAISSLIGIFSTQKWSMEKPRPCVNVYVLQIEKAYILTVTKSSLGTNTVKIGNS